MDSSGIIRLIQGKIRSSDYRLSLHAEKERHADRILISELEETAGTLELVENYPDDPRGASCLSWGLHRRKSPYRIIP